MCEPKNSRFKLQHAQIPVSQTSKPALVDRSSLSSQNLPLKSVNLPQPSNDKFCSPPCGKENISSPVAFPKGTKSEKVKAALKMENSQSANNDKNVKGKQRSEKNYRDLNKSLANLVRVPGSSSGDDGLNSGPSKDFSVTANLGPKMEESKNQNFSVKRGQAKTPQISTLREQSLNLYTAQSPPDNQSHPLKKEKYQQGRGGGVSIAAFNKENKKSGCQGVGYSYYKGVYAAQRQLLTEPDAPVQREDFLLRESFSPDFLMRRAEKKVPSKVWKGATSSVQERITTQQDGRLHTMGPKLFGSGKKLGEMEEFYEKQSVENPDMLNFNNISDGVSYGIGGVGIGRRERVQEGDSMDASIDKKMREDPRYHHRQSLEAGPSIQSTTSTQHGQRTRVSHWKSELLEIRKDIERRKQSYEKVNKFFTICDENGSFVVAAPENESETVTTFPVKRNPQHASQQQSHGGGVNTLQTLQTLPSQYGDRVVSPSFSSFNNNQAIVSKLPYKNRGSKLFADIRTTEGNEDMRASREDHENASRIKTVSHYEYATLETHGEELNNSFSDNVLNQKPPKPSCCGTGSGCQIF
jgi:hypothetical protein